MSGRSSTPSPRVRAVQFIQKQGNDLAKHTAAALLGVTDGEHAADAVRAMQCTDGGFSATGCDPSVLAETRRALGVLDDLGIRDGDLLQAVCAHLARLQRDDGRWGCGSEDDEDLFETGMILTHLAKTTSARIDMLEAAADFLSGLWSPDRVQGFEWRPLMAYAGTFSNLSHERSDEILQWCGRELERGFRAGRFDGVQTVRLLSWCDAPQLPGGRLEPAELLKSIFEGQAEDGGWLEPGEASIINRVGHTLAALVGLRRLE
ncbi:MAG: hypothetical protein E2P06_16555 [Acidobacteria bacterium]|nr:hypothetical protein [Myxococcales bacterium]TDI19190.1 MAG: hypothetical protein E2P06_16555 [Acidobacteriota bacterium]